MKINYISNFILFIICTFLTCCYSLDSYGQETIKLEKEISLPGVKGRIDHMDVNIKDQIVYIAALGNNTLEVVDIKKGIVLHSITGLSEPQGVAFISKHQEIFVANGGTGECCFYDAKTFQKTASIKYPDDADDVRYDEASDRVYVGYGSGGIASIDAAKHKQTADFKLPAHPESFQLDNKEGKIWVNLPGAGMIGVVDIKKGRMVDEWKKLIPRSNFPMSYDQTGHRLFVGYRLPATLKVLDSQTGKEVFSSAMVSDVDDFYWDEKTKQIFISGGGGSINIFTQMGNTYKQTTNIPTRKGARTSLLVPELHLFLLAARENSNAPASLLIYKLSK